MNTTPKSLRLCLGLFGRMNVGKSSFLNLLAGEDIAIVSEQQGTTTDIVEKPMEIAPIGPIVFLDTAGLDDTSVLGQQRIEKTKKSIDRVDVALLILNPNQWTSVEEDLVSFLQQQKKKFIFIVNKTDQEQVQDDFVQKISQWAKCIVYVSCWDRDSRDQVLEDLKKCLLDILGHDFQKTPSLLEGLIAKNHLIAMVVPLDVGAPKGRLILPQVQTIREALDQKAMTLIVKEDSYVEGLKSLSRKPDLVICDSQVVADVIQKTPQDVLCTTFSILMMLFKVGATNFQSLIEGAKKIDELQDQDKVLIAESCTHHASEDDIGKVKLPLWLRQYTQKDIVIDHMSGRDYPKDLSQYQLIIHCGGCMLNQEEMRVRIQKGAQENVPITNYGLAISLTQGVLKDVLKPFEQSRR